MDFIEELTWRGMVHTVMPGTEEQLKERDKPLHISVSTLLPNSLSHRPSLRSDDAAPFPALRT